MKFLLLALSITPAFSQNLTPAWVELGPNGAVARIVVDPGATCPLINMDGRSTKMRTRVEAPAANFPLLVCEARIPGATKKASVEVGSKSFPLVLAVANPRRIVVIGDTGCRLKTTADTPGGKVTIQNCEDPEEWPFPQVARAAAAEKPDLVIHVGDYLYREMKCPEPAKCGSISGYEWPSWNADSFAPAAELLQAAPWIFVRGNHEDCARAWQGFYFLLDPRDLGQLGACATPYSAPYVVKLGTQQFAVLDSAHANDTTAPIRDVEEYARQYRSLLAQGFHNGWMLTHRRIWGFGSQSDKPTPLNATLGAAWEKAGIKRSDVSLVIAGHIHLFELLSYEAAAQLPPQLVVGNKRHPTCHASAGGPWRREHCE
jgi:predicted phosphodiesterase